MTTKPYISGSSYVLRMSDFKKEIAPCRTFCFLHELEMLLDLNLIKGGDINNAIVVGLSADGNAAVAANDMAFPNGTVITKDNLAAWITAQIPPQGISLGDQDAAVWDWTVDNTDPENPRSDHSPPSPTNANGAQNSGCA